LATVRALAQKHHANVDTVAKVFDFIVIAVIVFVILVLFL
jgi:DNA-binding transcriptional regulator YhcF (GntR family)